MSQRKRDDVRSRSLDDGVMCWLRRWRKEGPSREVWWPLDAAKGKETDASLEPSERKETLQALDVNPVPPVSDFSPAELR